MRPRTAPEGEPLPPCGKKMFVSVQKEAALRAGVVMGRRGKTEEEAVSNVSTLKKARELYKE